MVGVTRNPVAIFIGHKIRKHTGTKKESYYIAALIGCSQRGIFKKDELPKDLVSHAENFIASHEVARRDKMITWIASGDPNGRGYFTEKCANEVAQIVKDNPLSVLQTAYYAMSWADDRDWDE